MSRKSLKIQEDVYDALKEHKDKHQTWSHFFMQLVEEYE